MAKIIKIKNPITNTGREVIDVPLKKPVRFSTLAKRYGLYDGRRYVVAVRGEVINTKRRWNSITIEEDDVVSVLPYVGGGGKKGKRILSIIGSIALAAASWGAGRLFATAAKGWTTASYIASAATSFLGGLIIQKLTPKPKVDFGFDEQSREYEWQLGSMNMQQGGVVPVVYGTVRPQMTLLSYHVISEDSKQYIQMLLCPCEGPIDEIKNIRINNNPIENYKDVFVETRLGTNTQSFIPQIGDLYADQTLGYELVTDWRYYETEGDAGEGLEITIEFPAGLYYSNDEGGASRASVTVKAEIQKQGESSWRHWGTWTIDEAKTTSFRRVYRLDNLKPGRYNVRLCSPGRSGGSLRHINKCFWSQLSHIMYQRFDRPGKALIGIKALATDQLSGSMPEVTCEVVRSKVWVFNSYSLLYEQQPADNPAWACYDMWHRCELLEHPRTGELRFTRRGVPKEYMLYDDFKAWADKCEENNLKVNIALNKASRKQDHVNEVALCGRGNTLTRGTKIGCVFDCVADMVQVFNIGNIIEGSFHETFLSLTDRANIIELSYFDKERNYQSETVRCYSQGWEKIKGISNPTQVRFDGITNRKQAWREAEYQARKNQHEVRMVSIKVKYEAVACQVGDVIGIQHDVPEWGYGGRIVKADVKSITLDREIEFDGGVEYDLLLRLRNDTIYTKRFTGIALKTAMLEFPDDLPDNINTYDIWAVGEVGRAVKPFRVLNITRSGNDWTERTLWCMEYIKEVYDENEDVPDIDYSVNRSFIRGLLAIRSMDADGTCLVKLTWLAPREQHSKIKVFVDDEQVAELGGDATSYSWQPDRWGLLNYSVKAVDYFGNTKSSASISYQTDKPLPPDVKSFTVTFLAGTKQFIYDWSVPEEMMPVDGYEIRRGQTWDAGQTVKYTPGKNMIRDDGVAVRGFSTFWICAKNRYGYSKNPLRYDIEVDMMADRDVIKSVQNYEESGSVEGNGALIGGVLIQHSGLKVGEIKSMLWQELKKINWFTDTAGPVIVTGAVIDIGKPTTLYVWVNEEWAQTPDMPNIWQYQTSFDNIKWSDWRALPNSEIEARYFRFKLTVRGVHVAGWLRNATIIMDVPENTIKLPAVAIPSGGVYVKFEPQFVNAPTIQITPNNDKRIVQKTQISAAGCFVQLFDAYSNSAVAGVADIFATGF